MNYQFHYEALIARGRTRTLLGYKEIHHILPRCMGGTDDKSNLVALTAEEHFVAHLLLVKIFPGVKGLIGAAHLLSRGAGNNKVFGWLRRRSSEANKGNQYGLGRIHSAETRAKISAIHKGKKKSDEHIKKMSEAKRGKPNPSFREVITPEIRAKIAKLLTGRKQSPETIAKRVASLKGRPGPQLGIPRTDEERRKISLSMKGIPKTAETKARMSKAQEGNKHALGLKRGPMSEEHKRKMIESKKRNREARNAELKRLQPQG